MFLEVYHTNLKKLRLAAPLSQEITTTGTSDALPDATPKGVYVSSWNQTRNLLLVTVTVFNLCLPYFKLVYDGAP